MKDNNTFALKMNKGGELLLENSDDAVKAKYKPDSLLLCAPVSYLLMLFCVVIDIAFFRSLFVRISYDSPIMIWGQVAGLAFAADVVAAFAGILAKKIRQGLSHDKFNLALLLAVPIFALIINGVLRFSTMSLSSADGIVDAATIALTIIAIATPVFTSVGNFAISFELYNPLAKQLCREEIALNELQDSIRRLEAIQDECNSFNSSQIQDADHQHLINAKKDLINDSLPSVSVVDIPSDTPIVFDTDVLEQTDAEESNAFDEPVALEESQVEFVADEAAYRNPEAALETIRPIADYLAEHESVSLLLVGSTAGDITDESALRLSQARADAVKKTLCDDLGIDESRIHTLGMGSSDPWHISNAGYDDGAAASSNRKVTLISADTELAQSLMNNH